LFFLLSAQAAGDSPFLLMLIRRLGLNHDLLKTSHPAQGDTFPFLTPFTLGTAPSGDRADKDHSFFDRRRRTLVSNGSAFLSLQDFLAVAFSSSSLSGDSLSLSFV